jgi:muconolactone delta-isomerase
MSSYMVDIELPKILNDDFIELIPKQRAYIDRMMKKGIILSYSVSFDRSRLWVIVAADSIQDVKNILGSFPIFNYIKFSIFNLLFHEANTLVPQFWLN